MTVSTVEAAAGKAPTTERYGGSAGSSANRTLMEFGASKAITGPEVRDFAEHFVLRMSAPGASVKEFAHSGYVANPILCLGIDQTCQGEHFLVVVGDRAAHDRLVMRKPIAKGHEVRHQGSNFGAISRACWKGSMQMRDPELLILLVEQGTPEPEGQTGDDPSPGWLLPCSGEPPNRVVYTSARCIVEHRCILKPGVAWRRCGLYGKGLRVDRISKKDLDVMQGLEGGGRYARIPDIKRQSRTVVAFSLGKVRRKSRIGNPC